VLLDLLIAAARGRNVEREIVDLLLARGWHD